MHTYWIDIVGTCNLRCPSCPTGNYRQSEFLDDQKPLGFMSPDKLSEILEKIAREQAGRGARIELYNWGEPLLHPKAPELIAMVKSYRGFRCGISSNLSLKVDLSAVVAARPDWFRVSLSGFYPATYSLTHRRGDVDLVKANMRKLREAMDVHALTIPVEVAYHLYRHNAAEDFEQMQRLCDELHFQLKPTWAQFYPLEKVMAYTKGQISQADQDTISLLAIEPKDLLKASQARRAEPCRLQESQTAINYDGSVQLCCATYDPALVVAPDFLAIEADNLMNKKFAHATCNECIAGGFHSMMMYYGIDAVEAQANALIAENGAHFRLVAGTTTWKAGAE
jgi:MoaA/NifB/PqqE/SkfB family radical SAM enzyme